MSTTEADKKSDVFSFAIILWEMLHRELPWMGSDGSRLPAAEIRDHALEGERLPVAPRISGAQPALLSLLTACWDQEPSKRPEFCEIQKSLQSILSSKQ